VSATPPPEDPRSGSWDQPPPPPPPGGYPPPPGSYPPPPPGGYQSPPAGYPPPPPSWQQPPGGGYGQPGGGYGPPGGGGQPGGQLAGWWLRVGATVVDGLVLLIPNLILRYAGGPTGGGLLSLIVDAAYITLMLGQKGQTVGNMAVHTRVVDSRTGGQISYGKALGRWASELVLVILFVIPWILDILWPLWDRDNQTLHDKMAGTVVLRDQY